VTISERLGLLRACWQWGIKKGWLKENPWNEVKVKVPPKQRPKPFTKEEAKRIVQGFKDDPTYAYYLDFVEFLLATGCRIGEAAGLRWGHLNEDCSAVWIGESWGRGKRKSTKTNKSRMFALTSRVQGFLSNRKPVSASSEMFVFQSPKGHPIDDHNFRNRAWKPILERVGVAYRMPRNSRHTFVSHAIDQGLTLAEVSEITGHSPRTLMLNYLGSVQSRAQLPELWE